MKNKYDVLLWIDRCIKSCTTYEHGQACYKLLLNFQRLYGLSDGLIDAQHTLLQRKIWDKQDEIIAERLNKNT